MRPDDRKPAFPSTRWSRILQPNGSRDLEALARTYAAPIRAWLLARTRCHAHDADDLAQEAFTWLLTSGFFAKADPARGRFRAFLKHALANFATEQWRRANAQKRGGDARTIPFGEGAEPADTTSRTPDQQLDEAWRRELLQQAQARLQQELEGSGRGVHWALFRDWFLTDADVPGHQALAAKHGITRTDVSNWLDHGKRRYRALLRDLVADTVGDDDELQDELRWLFGDAAKDRP